jgi:hypothetical protein
MRCAVLGSRASLGYAGAANSSSRYRAYVAKIAEKKK